MVAEPRLLRGSRDILFHPIALAVLLANFFLCPERLHFTGPARQLHFAVPAFRKFSCKTSWE